MPVGLFETFAIKDRQKTSCMGRERKVRHFAPGTIAQMFDRGSREHRRAHAREANVDAPWI